MPKSTRTPAAKGRASKKEPPTTAAPTPGKTLPTNEKGERLVNTGIRLPAPLMKELVDAANRRREERGWVGRASVNALIVEILQAHIDAQRRGR